MTHIIEVEETVKLRHQIFIESDSEAQVYKAAFAVAVGQFDTLDDVLAAIETEAHVFAVNENCCERTVQIQYAKDYPAEVAL